MGRLKAPITVQLEATNECNNRCKHCYNYWRYLETGEEIVDENNRFLEVVDRLIEGEVFHTVITGGEPLLHFQEVLEGMHRLRENNVFVTMNTNLALLTLRRMQALQHAGLQGVLTSIYSEDPDQHNCQMNNATSWEDTLHGIDIVVGSGLPIGVNMVVTKDNLDKVYETGKFLHERGITRFHATRFCPAVPEQHDGVLTKRDMKYMLDQLVRLQDEEMNVGTLNPVPYCFENGAYAHIAQDRACSAGLTSVGIGIDGSVRACQHTDIKSGNLLETSLQEIWQEMPVWRREMVPEACAPCAVVDECGGGCKNFARVLKGDLKGVDPLYTGPRDAVTWQEVSGNVESDARYVVDPHLKVREEERGGVLFKDPHHYAIVDSFTYRLMPVLSRGAFTANEIADTFSVSLEKTTNMLWFLEKQGLIHKEEHDG